MQQVAVSFMADITEIRVLVLYGCLPRGDIYRCINYSQCGSQGACCSQLWSSYRLCRALPVKPGQHRIQTPCRMSYDLLFLQRKLHCSQFAESPGLHHHATELEQESLWKSLPEIRGCRRFMPL